MMETINRAGSATTRLEWDATDQQWWVWAGFPPNEFIAGRGDNVLSAIQNAIEPLGETSASLVDEGFSYARQGD
jgi:hypothetical protein